MHKILSVLVFYLNKDHVSKLWFTQFFTSLSHTCHTWHINHVVMNLIPNTKEYQCHQWACFFIGNICGGDLQNHNFPPTQMIF